MPIYTAFCGANQWAGFYMITASAMKGLNIYIISKRISKFSSACPLNKLIFMVIPVQEIFVTDLLIDVN